jgi:hypothetical protein
MSRPRLILLFIVLLAGGAWAAGDRRAIQESALIRQRIDALLKRRQQPEPLPAEAPNPFALQANIPTVPNLGRESAAAAGGAEPAPVIVAQSDEELVTSNTAELLARFASRLRITGMIRLKDQVHIIINETPWKEGDYLIINQGRRIFRLQVMRIQTGQLTLRLEDAELMLRF